MPEQGAEEPIEDVYRNLTDFLQANPLAYAGYRILEIKKRGSNISEAGEIPLVTTPTFPAALLGYILFVRMIHLWSRVRNEDRADPLPNDGHLFSMTSRHGYRTRSFLDVAREIRTEGKTVRLLCSPAAASEQGEWEARGFQTTTHRRLHGRVSIASLAASAVMSAHLTRRLWSKRENEGSFYTLIQCYNFILLEHVKRESIRTLTENDPNIHTFSAMPYLVDSTSPDRLFAYQHGLQMANYDRVLSLPFFTPMQLLIWGDAWRERFQKALHSESTIHVVGSPWYDYLASRQADREPRTDVLLVGGSHGLTDPAVKTEYEQLARNTVETCKRNNYSLAIKLHPLASPEWYEQRGWGEYVTSFDDIDEALLQTRVSVTNSSTAFIESAVLSVPVLVADLFEKGLADLAPVDYIQFTEGPEVSNAIEMAVEGDEFRSEESRPLVVVGGARDRIVDIVTQSESAQWATD
jgi:hypothetical protein